MARAVKAAVERDGAVRLVSRIAAAVLGNYLLTLGAASLAAVLLTLAGMARSEAAVLSSMLAFVLYLAVLIWAFHTRRLARLWLILAVTGAVCYCVAHALAERWL